MDGWTKGGIDVVCWSVPSFQHTIYPPKSPSLYFLPLLSLIPFSCCCCQNHLKRFVVTGDTFHQFSADSPCLIGVQLEGKQQNDLHVIYCDIQVISLLDGSLCLVWLYQLLPSPDFGIKEVISTNYLSQLCMYILDTLHVIFGKLR